MTPLQKRFCDNARKLYQALYNQPFPGTDLRIFNLAMYLRIRSLDDPDDVVILLDAMQESTK